MKDTSSFRRTGAAFAALVLTVVTFQQAVAVPPRVASDSRVLVA